MNRIAEMYRGHEVLSYSAASRSANGSWTGSYRVFREGVQLACVAVATRFGSEVDAAENALRLSKHCVDKLAKNGHIETRRVQFPAEDLEIAVLYGPAK